MVAFVSGYTPLFDNLTTGTLCGRWPDIGLWPVVLSMSDKNGVVDVFPVHIARVTGLSLPEVVACMKRFCEPDPYSRSRDCQGARLRLLDDRDWGWQVVNHSKYREKARLQAKDAARTESGRDAERKRTGRQVGDDAQEPGAQGQQPPYLPLSPPVSPAVPLSDSNTDTNTNPSETENARAREAVFHEEQREESELRAGEGNAWRDVADVCSEAMEAWLAYLAQLSPPKRLSGMSRISTAKLLASWGDHATQLRTVNHCIGNNWKNLRHADAITAAPGARCQAKSAEQLEAEARARGVNIWEPGAARAT